MYLFFEYQSQLGLLRRLAYVGWGLTPRSIRQTPNVWQHETVQCKRTLTYLLMRSYSTILSASIVTSRQGSRRVRSGVELINDNRGRLQLSYEFAVVELVIVSFAVTKRINA